MSEIDETLFNQLKIDMTNNLSKGVDGIILITPIEKVAFMEAYIEYHSKYPISTSMIEVHRKLSSRNKKKLAKLLVKTDFDKEWTKRRYRKFVFKYYSIIRNADTPNLKIDNFSESVQKFIIRRAEQQILMDGFVKRGKIASRIIARIKMLISFSLNVMMFKEVGAFYSFYEIKLFTPSDDIVDKIYKHGLYHVKDDLVKQYRRRAGIEVVYNQIRPYMVLIGVSLVATSNYVIYSETGDLPIDKRDEIKDFYESVKSKLYKGMKPSDVKTIEDETRKSYLKNASKENIPFVEDLLPQ
jgi:hypothetical protein